MAQLMLLRRGLSTLAAVGVVVVIGLVAHRASQFADDGEAAHWRIASDISLSGFQLDQVGKDGMELRLKADSAQLLEDQQRLDASGLDLTVFDKGVPAMTLIADNGELSLDNGAITVRGVDRPATLTVADGPTVTAPALSWDPDTQTVESLGAATIFEQGFTATGAKAVATLNDERIQLSGGVEVSWTQ